MIKDILLLGDERLYEKSALCEASEMEVLTGIVEDLHDTLMDYRQTYGAGRAIAAPQIGAFKRLIYMNIGEPTVMINPRLEFVTNDQMEVLDDCMSFPGLYVKVMRHKKCKITYFNERWEECSMSLEDDLSELIQHEYDHLDGILATMRAIDNRSLVMKKLGR